jgi:hypothetical protein
MSAQTVVGRNPAAGVMFFESPPDNKLLLLNVVIGISRMDI